MEETIINCETREVKRRQFTAAEIETELVRKAKAAQDEAKRQKVDLKRQLMTAYSELREIIELVKEGILEQGDLDAHQALIAKLKELTKSG